jgi:hypothetical protein
MITSGAQFGSERKSHDLAASEPAQGVTAGVYAARDSGLWADYLRDLLLADLIAS